MNSYPARTPCFSPTPIFTEHHPNGPDACPWKCAKLEFSTPPGRPIIAPGSNRSIGFPVRRASSSIVGNHCLRGSFCALSNARMSSRSERSATMWLLDAQPHPSARRRARNKSPARSRRRCGAPGFFVVPRHLSDILAALSERSAYRYRHSLDVPARPSWSAAVQVLASVRLASRSA